MLATLQALVGLFEAPSYLEVGVQAGLTFHNVSAVRKIAVDPAFAFDVEAARRENPGAEYHAVPSDEFFAAYDGPAFDVVYLDGLHTSEQTLRDLINTLQFIKSTSVVVLDDVSPNSYGSSLRTVHDMVTYKTALGSNDPAWMGDVYRLVYFVDTFMQQYSYASPIGGNPQLVLWRQSRPVVAQRTLAEVGATDFVTFVKERAILNTRPLDEIVSAVKAAGVGDRPTV